MYFSDNSLEQNAAFERCVGFLAEMIEKYGGEIEFPDEPPVKCIGWDNKSRSPELEKADYPLTDDIAA